MKKLVILGLAILFVGCATAKVEKLSANFRTPVLTAQQRVFIALPQDGAYQNRKYEYTGQQVQQAFFDQFSRYADDVRLTNQVLSAEQAQKTAYGQQAEILVYPIITLWEDRNTSYSAMRDKVKISVFIYDVKSGRLLDKTALYATSSSMRWTWWGNPSPERLLKKVINPYVKSLYQK